MAVLMFQKRFADAVKSGRKCQTIRPRRKRPIEAGDVLHLCMWEGKAYRSRQVELLTVKCLEVADVCITSTILEFGANTFWGLSDLNTFAERDGFESWNEMRQWFKDLHGLPFVGSAIRWGRKCDLCGCRYMPNWRLSGLKGMCESCNAQLGGGSCSASIVQQEARKMARARA